MPSCLTYYNWSDHRKKSLLIDGKVPLQVNLADEYINKIDALAIGDTRTCGWGTRGCHFLVLSHNVWDLFTWNTGKWHHIWLSMRPYPGFAVPFDGIIPLDKDKVGRECLYWDILNHAWFCSYHGALSYLYRVTTCFLFCKFGAERVVDVSITCLVFLIKSQFITFLAKTYYPTLRIYVKIYEYTPGFIRQDLVSDNSRGLL